MDLLEAVVQPYDWGSRRVIAELQGRPAPAPGPEAELWMGAHPSAPSRIRRNGRPTGLDAAIAADPVAALGVDCARRFGRRLPFLLKVLAAEKALSIQVHPNRDEALAGFAAEEARGLPRAERNYVDDWPKPEILCALTPFEVLAGFREPEDAADLLASLRVRELAPTIATLRGGGPETLIEALRLILAVDGQARRRLFTATVSACEASAARAAESDDRHAPARAAAVRIARDHDGDLGVVASLLLRHAVLQPGEGLYMPPGAPHAYLRGAGVEVLANSDNVMRAGLTRKRVDVTELLRVLRPEVPVPLLRASTDVDGVTLYDAGVPEFRLYRLQRAGGAHELPGSGPRIALSVDGPARLASTGHAVLVPPGGSCFVPAEARDVVVTGPVSLFVAAPGVQT